MPEHDLIKIDSEQEVLNEEIDESLETLPVTGNDQAILDGILKADTAAELQKQFDLFNMNQSKKNALRIVKLNGLLDKVEDQAIERFEKHPDYVSNKELLEYMTVVSTQIEKAQKQISEFDTKPSINIISQSNDVNINVGDTLDRDGRERVMDAINALLKQVKEISADSSEEKAIIIEENSVEDTSDKI